MSEISDFSPKGKRISLEERNFLLNNGCRWCSDCKSTKEIAFFGSNPFCLECLSKRRKKHYKKNKKKTLEVNKKYREKHLSKIKKYEKRWRKENSSHLRDYRNKRWKENPKMKETHRSWRKKNRERINVQARNRAKERRKNDINYKILTNLRARLQVALQRSKVSRKFNTMTLIGCSIEDFKIYLENKFQEGMSWDNYGKFGWHIDHIKPCAAFDLSDPKQQQECFHYTNLQPLWAIDNIKKGAKYAELPD